MGFRFANASIPALAVIAASACSSSTDATGAKTSAPSTLADAAAPDSGTGGLAPSQLANGCPVNSGYLGDAMCLAAPATTSGFQLHYGPASYSDAAGEAPYLLQPGEEINDCYYEKTSNTADEYIGGFDFQMRPGSHHIIMNVNPTGQPDGFATCGANDQAPGLLYSSQTPTYDMQNDPAPENQGLAVKLLANSQAVINFHVINTTSKPILREAWLNYFYIDPSQVKGIRGNVFLVGGLGYQITPGTKQTYQYSCSPTRPTRILTLAAHMHAHSSRMTVWKVSAGQPTMVYESYSWENPVGFSYDSVHTNPAPDRATQTPGASSGQLTLQPTDTLQWECAVDNTSSNTLTFRNEVYTGEMCIVGGTMVPADDPMNPYDFTCTRN
ncbi:MAG: hypothetical protein ACREJ3_19645 [Polyangiaceae bacterium]